MRLTVLGTAAPYPRPQNACSGYLLEEAGTTLWIDAGTGTLAELQRHTAITAIDAVWVSHRHADHSADLLVAYYALAASALRPTQKLRVIGPEGLKERLADFLGPEPATGLQEVFEFAEMHGWGDTSVGAVDLSWGPVSHGVPAFALTVEARNIGSVGSVGDGAVGDGVLEASTTSSTDLSRRRGLTYSGDTGPCTSLVEMAEQSATLVCEAASAVAGGRGSVHLTPEEAGATATDAGVARLVLTHLAEGLAPAEAARRASATFTGTVDVASPGDVFDV